MGLSRVLRRRQRSVLLTLAVLVIFLVALLLWIGRQPGGGAYGPGHGALDGTSNPSASASLSASAKPGKAQPAGAAAVIPSGGLFLPPLSTDINGGPHGTHIVTMRATSDLTILQLAWAVRGGHPGSGYRQYVLSPMSMTTVAHGDGIVAEIALQGGPLTKYVSCEMTVDGKTTSHTAKGPYAVVLCFG